MAGGTATMLMRAPLEEEAGQLAVFVHALSVEVGVQDTTDATDVRHEWREPGFDRERHARVVSDGRAIIASADFYPLPPMGWGGAGVLPAHRGKGIGSAMLDWVIQTAKEAPDVETLYTSANVKLPDALALIESRGFAHVRTFFRMIHRAPGTTIAPTLPDGIRLDTSLRGDTLVDALIAGHDGSFIDHWNFHPWRQDEIAHMFTHPDVDPELLLIAFGPDGQIAGVNLCFLEQGDGFTHGTVGVLGTTRPFRGIGLGSALLRLGVRALADRGATLVDLGVDSENMTGALGMYERAGFERDQERHTYELDVS